jgi:hypothetical protein
MRPVPDCASCEKCLAMSARKSGECSRDVDPGLVER